MCIHCLLKSRVKLYLYVSVLVSCKLYLHSYLCVPAHSHRFMNVHKPVFVLVYSCTHNWCNLYLYSRAHKCAQTGGGAHSHRTIHILETPKCRVFTCFRVYSCLRQTRVLVERRKFNILHVLVRAHVVLVVLDLLQSERLARYITLLLHQHNCCVMLKFMPLLKYFLSTLCNLERLNQIT